MNNSPTSSPLAGAYSKLIGLAKKAASVEQASYADFHYETKAERAHKLVFDPSTNKWKRSTILVKIEEKPFAHGAFRAVHRMKVWDGGDWHKSSNFVCKMYLKEPAEGTKKAAMDDVSLQMIAKHYGQLFNHHNPPKAIDFIYTFVIALVDRPNQPYCCVEAHIDGEYVKYSNNSGWYDKEHLRNTPHAFSHFTFEESGGKLLIVDIQGVNDLYTDPQIHSSDGTQFGTGNLGLRGMALFLFTHHCNFLCKKLKLPEFDNYPLPAQPAAESTPSQPAGRPPARLLKEATMTKSFAAILSNMGKLAVTTAQTAPAVEEVINKGDVNYEIRPLPENIPLERKIISRIHYELAKMHATGQLHADDPGKAHDPEPSAKAAAFYHYQIAAAGGVVSAMLGLARIHSGLPRDILPDANVIDPVLTTKYLQLAAERKSICGAYHYAKRLEKGETVPKNWSEAIKWYEKALNRGEAEQPKSEESNVDESEEKVEETKVADDDEIVEEEYFAPLNESLLAKVETWGWEVEIQPHEVLSTIGKMYEDGGFGVEQDYAKAAEYYREAADEAMAAGKGRISAKLYEQAEMCEGMLE
eukprot:TRINITY_DN2694_c0_g1_i1.p1 TRINITY_DN2694_c0_g1~~TRINITY_DN2694_c0_g1_i1.p1  ORF type:complete len:584 (-),score=129.93 TRINITY_DN2694_c0_g1_i1:156-1907(-)